MSLDDEVRVESSVSVQSRVSILDLATLDMYYDVVEGIHIRSMSQLIALTIGAMLDTIEANEKLGEKFETVAEAHRYLNERGLYQGSLMRRNRRKLSTALEFESLREHGIDPKSHVPAQYNTVHRGEVRIGGGSAKVREIHKKAMETYGKLYENGEEEKVEMLSQEEVQRKYRKVGGIKEGMNEEELSEYGRAREEEVLGRENADIDKEELREQIVDD